jgi:hypothetical protein
MVAGVVAAATVTMPRARADNICGTVTITATDPDKTVTVCVPLPSAP